MSQKDVEFAMRINGQQYLTLSDGHRMALIIGMIDMLNVSMTRLVPQEQPRIQRLLGYVAPMSGLELCKLLDEYVSQNPPSKAYAIATNLIVAIAEKCEPGIS